MSKTKLPYSQSALILGILSIITACCCYGVIGIILGVIGWINANKAIMIYNEQPDIYEGYNNAKTGKITSIIGLAIGVIYIIYIIYLFASGEIDVMMEQYQEIIESQGY